MSIGIRIKVITLASMKASTIFFLDQVWERVMTPILIVLLILLNHNKLLFLCYLSSSSSSIICFLICLVFLNLKPQKSAFVKFCLLMQVSYWVDISL